MICYYYYYYYYIKLFSILLVTVAFATPSSSAIPKHRPSHRITANNGTSNVEYSNNWSGAVWESNPTGSFTSVSGTFKLPIPRSPDGSVSAWVGIDGDSSCPDTIWQAGIDINYDNGGVTYAAWYEWYPADSVYLDQFVFRPGDHVRLTVTAHSPTTGVAIIENLSNGQKVSQSVSSSTPLCRQNAEWIVEDFNSNDALVPMCNFGTVTFSNAHAKTTSGPDMSPHGATIFVLRQHGHVMSSVSENSSGITISYR